MRQVVVVGGGVSGLAAAVALRGRARVTVLEATAVVGGKLRTGAIEVPGAADPIDIDEGAESFLTRVPDGVRFAREVGLGDELVPPAAVGASLLIGRRLRPLPAGTVMGVPTELRPLLRAGVLSPAGAARLALDLVLPRTSLPADPAVGRYVRARLGGQVVDRLVDPLLGGVYAGRADGLSLRATLPQLAPVAAGGRSLLLGARQVRSRAARGPAGPPFATVRGGLGRLAAAAATASEARVLTSTTVREVRRRPGGWTVLTAGGTGPDRIDCDAVVLAVPAAAARRLLGGLAPHAAALLDQVPYASVALTTLVYRDVLLPGGSGYLVPPGTGGVVKAATFLTRKWPHLRTDARLAVVRASSGRFGDERDLQREDVELAGVVAAEIGAATGLPTRPVAVRVSRWGGGLPQYLPGHLERVGALRRSLPAGIAVCGAAYDGVGIPACVRSGEAAAELVAGAAAVAPAAAQPGR